MHSNNSNKPLHFPSFNQSPYILPLNAIKSNHPSYSKQTYYGNWATPLQDTAPTHWNAINEITRVRTYCSHKINVKSPYESKTTTKFYQPYGMGSKVTGCVNPLALKEETLYKKMNVGNKKTCKSEVGTYGRKMILRLEKILPKVKITDKRPITGSVIRKKSSEIINGKGKIRIPCNLVCNCLGDNVTNKNSEARRCPYRAVTPEVVFKSRPESRYNKVTLFGGLENGRKSPNYDIPIIDMNLKEYEAQDGFVPSFWKQ